MRSWFFVMLSGAFLLSSCGGSPEAPAGVNEAEQAAAAAPPPPPPEPAAEEPAEEPAADAEEAGGDCPAAMGAYEKFVDEYVAYMKKAASGDASALAGIASLMGQADKAGKEIAAIQGDLTVDCLRQYNEINQKMTSAAMEMSNATAPEKAEVEAAQEAANQALEAAGCMEKCQGMSDPMAAATCMQGCM